MGNLLRQLRHDLRGRLNTLMLCASALPHASDMTETIEFLDEIGIASDKVIDLLDQLDKFPPSDDEVV